MSHPFDKLLDARGMNCPMPLVNARKEIGKLENGQVLKVLATDRGSVAELVGQETEAEGGTNIYVHYVRRTA
jgi:tRNA 2-thiouridine synthesizing protein A